MNKIAAYLQSKNINTHAFAAFAFGFLALYSGDAAVKDFVDSFVGAYPALAKGLAFAVVVAAKYSHSSKPGE